MTFYFSVKQSLILNISIYFLFMLYLFPNLKYPWKNSPWVSILVMGSRGKKDWETLVLFAFTCVRGPQFVDACARRQVTASTASTQGNEAKPLQDPSPLCWCTPKHFDKQAQKTAWVLLDNQDKDHVHLEKVQTYCRKKRAWEANRHGMSCTPPNQAEFFLSDCLTLQGTCRCLSLILGS